MRRSAFVAVVVALSLTGAAALRPSQDQVEGTPRGYEKIRTRLAAAINERRAEEGLQSLSPEPRLGRAAQKSALAIARRMKAQATFEDAVRHELLEERLSMAGYEAQAFAVRFAIVASEAPDVAARLTDGGRELLRQDLPEIGIGIAPTWGSRIYVVVAALSAGDYFSTEIAGLSDLPDVRARLLERVNQARLESDGSPLKLDDCLSRIAQKYAERMLAEGFLSHTPPGGDQLEDRVRAGGCPHERLGETLAQGQTRVDEIAEELLASPEHRRTLLEPDFDAAGLGLAKGRGPGGFTTVWVQVLGTSAPDVP